MNIGMGIDIGINIGIVIDICIDIDTGVDIDTGIDTGIDIGIDIDICMHIYVYRSTWPPRAAEKQLECFSGPKRKDRSGPSEANGPADPPPPP